MSKTKELVKLLEKQSRNPENPFPYMAGYLENLVHEFEKEYKSSERILDRCINDLNNKTHQNDPPTIRK